VAPAALLLLTLAACGSSSSGSENKVVLTPIPEDQLLPVVISSDLAVGSNRFVLGLIDQKSNTEVIGAALHLRFFPAGADPASTRIAADPTAMKVTKSFTHTHPDGTVESHPAGETGAYVAEVQFDTAGTWQVEVTGTANGQALPPIRPTFSVLQKSQSLSVGDAAPRSVQTILKDVPDITQIDTSVPAIPEEHNLTIADAVTSGKPSVIVFATPAFCQSRICGPTKSIVDDLYRAYSGRANFVHVEPYDVGRMREAKCPSLYDCRVPIVDEWGLQTEPWVFMVDASGKIAAKFEGIVSYAELESALRPLVSPAG